MTFSTHIDEWSILIKIFDSEKVVKTTAVFNRAEVLWHKIITQEPAKIEPAQA